jgi:hypothetical protein
MHPTLLTQTNTVAKRLMSTETKFVVINSPAQTAVNLNHAIFKTSAAEGIGSKLMSLFPGKNMMLYVNMCAAESPCCTCVLRKSRCPFAFSTSDFNDDLNIQHTLMCIQALDSEQPTKSSNESTNSEVNQ